MNTTTARRKLIDIHPTVFEKLSVKAERQGVSLKRYIENLLEQDSHGMDAIIPEGVTDQRIISLIGIAKASDTDIQDERLDYLLSK